MSVIIRLQNLPWSANALDIRNYFRGLSIPEGGVHIVGGELGDAFIAFSTDEDARQAMMLDCGKIKEIQVKLLLSSRSEMHKVIEAARQTVPLLSIAPVVPAPAPIIPAPAPVVQPTAPIITPFSAALGNAPLSSFGIPGIGNPQEIPQPAVIEPPGPLVSPSSITPNDEDKDDEKMEGKRKERDGRRRSKSRSRSRDRDRKDRKRDKRDRSRSRERRRRDRSRSRDRRDRKRDRKDRSRSRERSPRRSRDRRNVERKSPSAQPADKIIDAGGPRPTGFGNPMTSNLPQMGVMQPNSLIQNGPIGPADSPQSRFNDPSLTETFNKLQELGKKRNPNAFQGDQPNGGPRFQGGRGGNNAARGVANHFRRDGRQSRFDDPPRDCCVAITNAPNLTSYGDVRRFFPFVIDKHGIKMINDNTGRRSGTIFVRFCDPRSKQLALQKKPNELKGAMVTVESLDDDMFESAVDSFLPYREDNRGVDHSMGNNTEESRQPSQVFSVLKLADLPNFVKEHDIMKTFSDFSLLSILLNDCRETRTKVAFVQFVKPEDARMAFERREGYLFGRRQPIITPVSTDEYEMVKISNDKTEPIMNNSFQNDQIQEPVVPRDPRQRRQPMENGPNSQVRPTMQQPQTRPPFFPNPSFPQMQNPNPFPNSQFPTFPGPGNMDPRTAASSWAARPNFPRQPDQIQTLPSQAVDQRVISIDMEEEPLDCVLMKGLPREATDRTILDFLADTGAVPARIHLMLDGSGHPSGDCFCEFRTPQEARQAASKHGVNLEGCRVTIDLVMRSVVEEALEGPKTDPPALLGNGPLVPQYFDSPRGGFPPRGRGRGGFDRGGYDRGGFNRGGFDHGRGNYRGRSNWNDRGGRGFDRGRGRGFGRGRGGFDNSREVFDNNREPVRKDDDQDPALEDFGAPGCVVSMENVPFRASVDDLLGFFGDFELTQDDVIRRYNERGLPTGDARVAFRTPFDAQRAVKTRHMNSIYDRRITLTIL